MLRSFEIAEAADIAPRCKEPCPVKMASKQQQPPKQKRSLCVVSVVYVALVVGRWLCFSAMGRWLCLKKDCVVLCLLCLSLGVETDVKTEEETGLRLQEDSRIREETGRKIKKRRESRGEVRKLALCLSSYCCYLAIVIVLLSCSLFSSLSSSLPAETAITLPAECEGASFPPDGTHST